MSGQRQRQFFKRLPATPWLIAGVMVIALAARIGAIVVWNDGLSEDRDGYLGIAHNLASGAGYSSPGTAEPTAFRPPLYPILLSLLFRLEPGTAAIGVLHVLLGTATVWLTYQLACRLGWKLGAIAAAGLVAVDPMLLRYSAYAMTETLFTFLVTLLLVLMCRPDAIDDNASSPPSGSGRALAAGVVFGLSALCRPTIWAFGGLFAVVWIWHRLRRPEITRTSGRRHLVHAGLAVLGVAVTVLPWGVRNSAKLDRFLITTTHGGYTLLLGNNPRFYEDVVQQPWGTVWDRDRLTDWQESLKAAKDGSAGEVESEIVRDRRLYNRALANIQAEPGMFLRACWLRFRRFWNVAPLNAAGQVKSRVITWGVGLYYSVMLFGLVVGLVRLRNFPGPHWRTLLLLLAAFSFVHLFYWSNARMRAPLIPAIAVLSVAGLVPRQHGVLEDDSTPNQKIDSK